ncbi:hypothetical protein HJC23_008938 [Cyclotella cryptica]|uniref:Uncharacterized protein n=1 Tax=Cyclotella cryptica TaxID=29204 RepID=A0ABD3Q106_9STRA|eukprot:CCRYP_009622-RA/>CCRYP_009622-RA protein AED:0.03 eAED:0.03 QI:191/1/1/1/0.81/0.75/12/1889/1555
MITRGARATKRKQRDLVYDYDYNPIQAAPITSKSAASSSSKSGGDNDIVHPLLQCPKCPRILPPRSLFGHYGRLHCPKGGNSQGFDWSGVRFVCPFCPRPENDTHDIALYNDFDEVQSHVTTHHAGKALIPPLGCLGKKTDGAPSDHVQHTGTVESKRPTAAVPSFVSSSAFHHVCPECKRTFMSRKGVVTHYGMTHGGYLDRIYAGGENRLNEERKIKKNEEEKEQHQVGHDEANDDRERKSRRISERASRRYLEEGRMIERGVDGGNETKISISKEPAKMYPVQPVRHVLVGCRSGGDLTRKKGDEKKSNETGDVWKKNQWTAEEHAAFIRGHKRFGNSWKSISQHYVPSRTPKQVGSHAFHYFNQRGLWEEAKKPYGDDIGGDSGVNRGATPVGASSGDISDDASDDGNFDYCVVCEDGGDIICCSVCPRAYHSFCIDSGDKSPSDLPNNWVCERCKLDSIVLPSEQIDVLDDDLAMDIRSIYSNFKTYENYELCCDIMVKISSIIEKLESSDCGYIFSEPVDLEILPDYYEKVSNPMDYGTLSSRLKSTEYLYSLKPLMKHPMEAVLLQVIRDSELVHKNCQLYNPKGSSAYRAGQTIEKKWTAFFNKYILPLLPGSVVSSYRCGSLDIEESPAQNINDAGPQKEGTQSKRTKPVVSNKDSSGLLLTKDQLDALECLFFFPTSHLTEFSCIYSQNNTPGHRSQWYDRLDDLRKYKLTHGTALVTISRDDKLYHWITRQRKRYHLTLFRKPQFKSNTPLLPQNGNDTDVVWLTTKPSMTGTFSMSPGKKDSMARKNESTPVVDYLLQDSYAYAATEIKTAEVIHDMHQQQLYFPLMSGQHYRHSSSLFWDECLEELRFFHGDHKHTLVPRSFPYNKYLGLWVEIQRAKFLLCLVGINSGLFGAQMFILDDELNLCDLSHSPLAADPSHVPCSDVAKMGGLIDLSDSNPDDLYHDKAELKKTPSTETPPLSSLDSGAQSTSVTSRSPLCKCPACERTFDSLRKVYGHFGRVHTRNSGLKVKTDEVLFSCPFCSETSAPAFKPLKVVEIHVENFHPQCQLIHSSYQSSPGGERPRAFRKQKKEASPKSPPKHRKSTFKRYLSEFVNWAHKNTPSNRSSMTKLLYLWCWRQCNEASAMLRGTPNVDGFSMSAAKVKLLASKGFFRFFPYNDNELIREDEYEGSEKWENYFVRLQTFSISHGSTEVPEYCDISSDFRAWITEIHNSLLTFSQCGQSDLSVQQIEKLILIGFCTDRDDLPNLNRSDVIWLKNFFVLSRYQLIFGDCHVTEDFPHLFHWVNEQKRLYELFRVGKRELMKVDRLTMLVNIGLDFFVGDSLTQITQHQLNGFENLNSTPSYFSSSEGSVVPGDGHQNGVVASFENLKVSNGHSLLLADENPHEYQWFITMRSALIDYYALKLQTVPECYANHHFVLSHIIDRDGPIPSDKPFKTKEAFVLWGKYCERFLMFKALKGHCQIPSDYPDTPLLQWVSKQQEELYLHCIKNSPAELPLHLKLLVSLGLKGKRRDIELRMSSRTMKHELPVKPKKKDIKKSPGGV